jgi:hypothetical protein
MQKPSSFFTRLSASHLVAAHLCLVPTSRDVDCPVNPGLVPSYKIFMSFRAEPLHHIEHMLRKLDPIGLLCIRHAMGYPPLGEETKPEVAQNSDNCRQWRVEGLTDLAGGRMRLLLKKSENCITKIVLRSLPSLSSSSTVSGPARNLAAHFSTAQRRSASW